MLNKTRIFSDCADKSNTDAPAFKCDARDSSRNFLIKRKLSQHSLFELCQIGLNQRDKCFPQFKISPLLFFVPVSLIFLQNWLAALNHCCLHLFVGCKFIFRCTYLSYAIVVYELCSKFWNYCSVWKYYSDGYWTIYKNTIIAARSYCWWWFEIIFPIHNLFVSSKSFL